MSKDLLFGLKVPVTGPPTVPAELTHSRTPSGFKRNLQQYLKINGVQDVKQGEFLQQIFSGALMFFSGGIWHPEYNKCVFDSTKMFAKINALSEETEATLLDEVKESFRRNELHIEQNKQQEAVIKASREALDGTLKKSLLERGLSWKKGPSGSAGQRKGGAAADENATGDDADAHVSKMLDEGLPEEQIAQALQDIAHLSKDFKEAKQVSRLTGEQTINVFMASISRPASSTPQQLLARKQVFCNTAQLEIVRCKRTAEALGALTRKFCEQQQNRVVTDALQQFNQMSSSEIYKAGASSLCLENGVPVEHFVLMRIVCKNLKSDIESNGGHGQVRNQEEQNFLNYKVSVYSRYDSATGKRTVESPNVDSIVRQIDEHIKILSEFETGVPTDSQKAAVFRKSIKQAEGFPRVQELSLKLEEQISQSKLAEVMELSSEALSLGAEATVSEIQEHTIGFAKLVQLAKAIWPTLKSKETTSKKTATKTAAEDEEDELQTANMANFGGGLKSDGKSGKGGKGRRNESHEKTSAEAKSDMGQNKSKSTFICRFFNSKEGCRNGQMCTYFHQAQSPSQSPPKAQQTSNKVDSQKCYICAWKKLVSPQAHYFRDTQFHTAAEIKQYTESPEYKVAMDKRREKRAAKYKANGAAAAADSDGSTDE